MQNRVLGSCRGLLVGAAIVTLVLSTSALAERPSTTVGGGTTVAPGIEKKITGPTFYERSNYVWPYSSGPYYGLTQISPLERSKAGMFVTAVGAIDVSLGLPAFPEELTTPNLLSQGGSQFFVVVAEPGAVQNGDFNAELETLAALGGQVIEKMAGAAFLVRLSSESFEALQGNPDILALFPYHAALKIDPSVGRVPLIDAERAVSDIYKLRVAAFPGTDLSELSQQVIALGSTSVQIRSGSSLVFYLHRSKLAALAQIPTVKQIVEDVPLLIQGEETTATLQAGTCGSASSPCLSPFHDDDIIGGGRATCTGGSNANALCQRNSDCNSNVCTRTVDAQKIAILDTGVQLDAADLSDTLTLPGTINDPNHRKVVVYESAAQFEGAGDLLGCDSSLSGGSTHGHVVASVAAGNATDTFPGYGGASFLFTPPPDRNPWKVDGVAPGALIVAYDAQKTPAAGGSLCGSEITIGNLYLVGDAADCTGVATPFPCCTGSGLGNCIGALEGAYSEGARQINMSFGTAGTNPGVYSTALSGAVDDFLIANRDAMTFASAGNAGGDSNMDGVPDRTNVGEPAVAKNGVSVGASLNTGSGVNTRAGFSSVGPATTASNRVAPLLMAPGSDSIAGPGLFDPYACRTNTNESTGPVVCLADEQIVIEEGTSFSAPAVAGASALIRDYFAQGYYPDGVRKTANQEPVISGALVKAILIASTEFMGNIQNPGGTLTEGGRFNFEQGYGRPELDNALPLQSWPPSPPGIVITDGSVKTCSNAPTTLCTSSANCPAAAPCDIPIDSTGLSGTAVAGTETYTFRVEDNTQALSIALAWIDPTGDALQKDLSLRLVAPGGGPIYKGNFFSEDVNINDVLDTAAGNVENCINGYDGDGQAGLVDEGAWSIPTDACGTITGNDRHDHDNPTEAIFLSPDANGDSVTCFLDNRCAPGGDDPDTPGIDEGDDNQIEVGTWTLEVIATGLVGTQDYSVVLVGPVASRSSVRFDDREYVCNDLATITINETDPSVGTGDNDTALAACGDNACRETEVESRTTVTVRDSNGVVVDSETGAALNFVQSGSTLSFTSDNVSLTDGTLRSSTSTYNNGSLDVRSGDTLRVEYADEVAGSTSADLLRANEASAECKVRLRFGGVNFGQFGQNTATLIEGGCERDARGKFTFGRPDKYMDAGEYLGYRIAFTSAEIDVTLDNVELTLRCVIADADSPKTCQPGTDQCSDPDRLNNAPCTQMTIVDSPKYIEALPPGAVLAANFAVVMASTITGTPDVDMLLGVKAETAGKTVENFIASRHKLDRDEKSVFYSTDFPLGGTETVDWNNDEAIATTPTCVSGTACLETERGLPTTDLNFTDDYRFETWVWSNLEANSSNQFLQAPWNFDSNSGGFSVVLMADSDTELIAAGGAPAQWGEDFNGNGVIDRVCSGIQGGVLGCSADSQCGRCDTFGLCQRTTNQQILDIGCTLGCSGSACGCGGIAFQCVPLSCNVASDCARVGGGGCDTTGLLSPRCSFNNNPNNPQLCTLGAGGDAACRGRCNGNQTVQCDIDMDCSMDGGLCNNPTADDNDCVAGPKADTCINGSEDRDDLNALLDNNWSTRGGCGWQSRSAGAAAGGIWHTGRIDFTTLTNCGTLGDISGQCQLYETIGTTVSNDKQLWFELLKTPVMHKVNQNLDGNNEPVWTSEHLNWAWNLAMDLTDRTAGFSWELDLNTEDIVASNLDRLPVFNALFGEHGPRSGGNSPLTNGFLAFAPVHVCDASLDGTPVACGSDEECDDLLLSGSCNVGASNVCALDTNIACANTTPDTAGAPQEVDPACDGTCNDAGCPAGGNCACDTDFDCLVANGGPGDGPCNVGGPGGQGGVGPCINTPKCSGSGYPCTTDDECRCIQNPGSIDGGIGSRGDTVNGSSTPFAGFCMWAPATPCTTNANCTAGQGPCVIRGNRAGRNSCFFEDPGQAQAPFNLPQPPDDDADNDAHCENRASAFCRVANDCGMCENSSPALNAHCTAAGVPEACCTGLDTGTCSFFCRNNDDCGACAIGGAPCATQADCVATGGGACNLAAASTTCLLAAGGTGCLGADGQIDEYIYPNGPVRTWDLSQVNGQDMRFGTLEDIYGDSGNTFQGGLGFLNFQGTGQVLEPGSGYGLGVDDMVVQWREFRLAKDETDCTPVSSIDLNSGGTCASVEIDTTQLYVGGAVVGVSIVDPFPYDPVNNKNDCNNDGDFSDTGTCQNNSSFICSASLDDCGFCTGGGGTTPCQTDADCLPSPGGTCNTGAANTACNADANFADDQDCNNNGTPDIVATGTSESLDLELIVLDRLATGVYRAEVTVSVTYDVPGTLFLSSTGTTPPTAEIRYNDRDDGTGNKCPNAADPATEGLVNAFAAVAITQGDVIVTGSTLQPAQRDLCDSTDDGIPGEGIDDPNDCNQTGTPTAGCTACGDADAFPDTNEILNLYLDVTNKSGTDFDDVTVRVLSSSSQIACILQPQAILGTLPKRGTAGVCSVGGGACTTSPCNTTGTCIGSSTAFGVGPFVLKVDNVSRTSTAQDFAATIKVLISSKTFNALLRPQEVQFEMDLNASGGGGSSPFSAGFTASIAPFVGDAADHLPANNEGSDGFRCQYNDPANPNANSLDNPNCFLGFAGTPAPSNHWHFHGTSQADGGKGRSPSLASMHYGKHGSDTPDDTLPLKQLDAAESTAINLGFGSPKLEFWHIISIMDYRGSNTPVGEAIDRAVVQVRRWDPIGNVGIGDWIKIAPYQNVYDVQGTDQFFNCTFDPVDDGNNEDSLFNPEDPLDIHGPSSTCYPEFVFAALGDSHPTRPFNAQLTGRASDPEFVAASGTGQGGTWMQSKFDLSRFRGRTVKIRFLLTTAEIEDALDWIDAGFASGSLIDDGWYIDDVLIEEALSSPPSLTVDGAANTLFPGCGAGCISVDPDLVVSPGTTVGPGQTVELNASASSADQCSDGTVNFRFWEDLDDSGTFSAGDTLLRNFTDNPIIVVSPVVTTTYGVDVICTSDPDCPPDLALTQEIIVACPENLILTGGTPFAPTIEFTSKTRLAWSPPSVVDVVRGNLITLRNTGSFATTIALNGCLWESHEDGITGALTNLADPGVGAAFFFVVRPENTFCNENAGSYSTKHAKELGSSDPSARDTQINTDTDACLEDAP